MSQYIDLVPSPASLLESLRSIGYSLEAAVADVVDNSIAAQATCIDIRYAWASGQTWIAIIDNGVGMSSSELITAMRLGSISPSVTRDKDDLGRFGLGLKTASFSQCRQLTVFSKQGGQSSCCQWDIDWITESPENGWALRIFESSEVQQHRLLEPLISEYLKDLTSGTIVLWEKLDRIRESQSSESAESHFGHLLFDVRKHLELVFHRFMVSEKGHKQTVEFRMNKDELEPFNPFNPRNNATQELPEQVITVEGEKVVVQPFVLPHHNKVSTQEYKKYEGDEGYLHNQGFYVYRNRRLIIKGSWFRLIKKNELNKLIRVRVDIPNSLDHLWKLDVKKSFASPPESVRQALQQIITKIELAGRSVYGQRGARLASTQINPVWHRVAKNGTVAYQINREHPLILVLLSNEDSETTQRTQQVLRVIESSFPADTFFNDFAQNPRDIALLQWTDQEFDYLVDLYVGIYTDAGLSAEEITARISTVDPFVRQREKTLAALKRKGIYQ